MAGDYDKNITLERRFSKQLKAILGNQFITQDAVMDRTEATDFAVLTVAPIKVAARLRRYKYWLKPQFRGEFTIRWALHSGKPTEIDKIRSGFVSYLLYGFVDSDEKKIISWFIGNLYYLRYLNPNPFHIYNNKGEGDSQLAVYRLQDLPEDFVIGRWKRSG